jgi:hypothetical protein
VISDLPAYLDTFVECGAYDIGSFSGDITYEFIVKSNPEETQASMALIGRIGHGQTTAALKYEQRPDLGTYGATVFDVADYDYGVPTAPGEYTHLVFVSSEAAGTIGLYVNGVFEGSVPTAITLSGVVGIGRAIRDPEGIDFIDNFDGDIFAVAIYDTALSDQKIARHSDSYFRPIEITDPNLLIYYGFESGKGTTVVDLSGHSNHSEFFGNPEWVETMFGGALGIERNDVDYIQTTGTLDITTNTVTVAGWIKHDQTPQAWSGLLTHRGSGNLGLQHNGSEGPNGAELRYMWGSNQYWNVSTGLLIPNGEWYYAALTIAPDQAKFYLNGVDQTFTHVAEHVPVTFDSEIRVGRDHNDDRIMTSLIDEVRFYNKTLTDAEILKIMGPYSDVTAPGDVIQGVPNDGLTDGSGNFGWPDAEIPDFVIDDNTETKYLHFKGELGSTGFRIKPASRSTIVTGLTFTTANDADSRDPISYELSGSNEGIDGPYELISSDNIVDFAQETAWPRLTMNATAITFANNMAYDYYQVMFPTVRDAANANSIQIAEVELLGMEAPVPENILSNGGFENGQSGGWMSWGDVSKEVVTNLAGAAVPEAPIEGDSCLHVTVFSAGSSYNSYGLANEGQGHVFQAGKRYTISAFLKCKEGTMRIEFKPELAIGPWTGYGHRTFTMTEEWEEYSVTTPVFTQNVSPISITFHIAFEPGEFWIDGVRFYEVE